MKKMTDRKTYTVYVSADLHMSANENSDDSIVSLMKLQRPVFDELTRQLKAARPDALILCGDNTQGGRLNDMAMLRRYLKTLNAVGIRVIMIGGNHDFDHCTESDYERMFYDLLSPDERDPASLSYLKRLGPYTFFAMDDHEKARSPKGVLKVETLRWLDESLYKENAKGQIPVFLSHHNLHADAWMTRPEFYTIAPPETKEILERHGVKLAFSGHLHDPRVYQSSLTEIITPAVLSGAHMYGKLLLQNRSAQYTLLPAVFRNSALVGKIREKDRMVYEKRKAAFAHMMAEMDECQKEKALEGLMRWLGFMQEGKLAEKRDELLADEDFQTAARALENSAYGAWIKALGDPENPSASQIITDL